MRVLLGLAALAVSVQAQTRVFPDPTQFSSATYPAVYPIVGQSAFAKIIVIQGQFNLGASSSFYVNNPTLPQNVSPANQPLKLDTYYQSSNWFITVNYNVDSLYFQFQTNQYTAQMQYRWYPNYPSPAQYFTNNGLSATSYICDPCSLGVNPGNNANSQQVIAQISGSAIVCNTNGGPGTTSPKYNNNGGELGFPCASFTRTYTMVNLVNTAYNSVNNPFLNAFAVQLWDRNTAPGPNVSSYSFQVIRLPAPLVGDPQIIGMQGQDFQVHGIPDEIFNLVTYPNLQVNARFVYLSSGVCHDNFTACFAHPGTYISEEGIRLGSDKIHVIAGSFKKGLTVSVNGKKVTEKKTSVKLGSVEIINHRRVVISTPIGTLAISNSDKFLNQESSLADQKLLSLGSERVVLKAGETFHSEVPLHGLQGQTWRNVEYPSGLDYEGSISDYHVVSGNLYGTDFTFNQFKQ
jgi:hypothetical protein